MTPTGVLGLFLIVAAAEIKALGVAVGLGRDKVFDERAEELEDEDCWRLNPRLGDMPTAAALVKSGLVRAWTKRRTKRLLKLI